VTQRFGDAFSPSARRLMPARTAVEAEGLVKRYGKLTAFDHLDLSVEEGEV